MDQKPLTIALADDDTDDQFFFETALGKIGGNHVLKVYQDGQELMEALTAEKEDTFLPDLIFLDQNMPRKNGLQCLEEIRGSERFRHIPVVVLNTCLGPADMEKVNRQESCRYFPKPDNVSQLSALLQKVFAEHLPSGNPLMQ